MFLGDTNLVQQQGETNPRTLCNTVAFGRLLHKALVGGSDFTVPRNEMSRQVDAMPIDWGRIHMV